MFFKVIRQISRSHGSKNRRFGPKLGVSGLYLQLEFTDGYKMMHRARSSIAEMPYCFSRSSVKFQGHTALKIVEFDPKWAFPDCNSSLKSPMAMKCCTKLETAKERCPIVFQGHLSNFKVTRYKTSPILTQIGRFRTIGQSQLSNPSDLPCSRSSIKFQGHTGQNITDFDPNWAFPDYRPVAAFKSLRFALLKVIQQISRSHGPKNCQF